MEMPRHCCVPGCNQNSGCKVYGDPVSFHSFPKDVNLQCKWVMKIREVEFLRTKKWLLAVTSIECQWACPNCLSIYDIKNDSLVRCYTGFTSYLFFLACFEFLPPQLKVCACGGAVLPHLTRRQDMAVRQDPNKKNAPNATVLSGDGTPSAQAGRSGYCPAIFHFSD